MATKFVTNLDLNQNQILNGRFQALSTDPVSSLFEGWVYYNTTYDTLRIYANGQWRTLINSVSSGGSSSVALTITESNGAVTVTPNLATTSADGVMSSADKTKLDNATSEATASRLAIRDVNGNLKVADPTDPAHAATKGYVDAARSGLDVKASVRAATTIPINISADLENGDVIDGVTLATGDRVLVKNQSTASENGIYVVAESGAAARAEDANSSTEVTAGMFTFVSEGTTNADSGWVLTTNDTIVLGTTPLAFAQFSGAGQITAGNGLTKTGNTIDAVGTADRITVNADSIDIASTYVGQSSITTLGTITTGTWDASTVAVTAGGTGEESFTDNGILYGDGSNALDVTAAGTQYQVLQAGSGGVPEFNAVNLAQSAAVTGLLPIANGGTNASSEANARTNLAAGGTQGSGVSVPVLTRKVSATVGDNTNTSFAIQHGFGTRDVMVQVYDAATYDTVIADTIRTDTNNVTVQFSVAPTANAYQVVIIG